MIALVGMLRYRHHHSLAEQHQVLHDRGITIGERTLLNLLAHYEELVSVHLTNQERLHSIFSQHNQVIVASDELRPDVGTRVLWVLSERISGEILLARPLLRKLA